MAASDWTRETVRNLGRDEIVLFDTTTNQVLNSAYATSSSISGYVHAHDGAGRALYDEAGRPILVPWQKQKQFTPSVAIAVWLLVLLQIGAVIAGIVSAVALHDLNGGGF